MRAGWREHFALAVFRAVAKPWNVVQRPNPMKLSVKLAESSPIGTRPERRILWSSELVAHSSGFLGSYEIVKTPIQIDGESFISPEVSYTPSNRILSLTVYYKASGSETPIFAGIAEWHSVPVYFTFQLPTGKFAEFYFEGDTSVLPDTALEPKAK
jgi:hypothetical protein